MLIAAVVIIVLAVTILIHSKQPNDGADSAGTQPSAVTSVDTSAVSKPSVDTPANDTGTETSSEEQTRIEQETHDIVLAYETDPEKAGEQYTDKTVAVRGMVVSSLLFTTDFVVVGLQLTYNADIESEIQCYFSYKADREGADYAFEEVEVGDFTTISGKCNGLLDGYLVITDSVILQHTEVLR